MESQNLVICDPETKFASAFAQYLTRQKELAVRVRTCSDLSYVLAIQEKEDRFSVHIFGVSGRFQKTGKSRYGICNRTRKRGGVGKPGGADLQIPAGRSDPGGNDSSVRHVRRREADILKITGKRTAE
ncbi:MAG: hypothetical protein ACLU80_10555 [Dorea sp.]